MITLQNVTRSFQSGGDIVYGLQKVQLQILPGESLAIVGPSGAGKSTLLSTLGLLDRPTAGSYHLDQVNTAECSERERALLRRERFGFVFQRFNLVEELSVFDNVALPLIYRAWTAGERENAIKEILERVGLEQKAHLRPGKLSGGQQQRVAIARALCGRPDIILCDEPTGSLDSGTGAQVLDLLLALHRESPNRILIVVTHNMEIARRLRRVVVIQDGQIVRDGRPKDVLGP